jgi:hypothetical protein
MNDFLGARSLAIWFSVAFGPPNPASVSNSDAVDVVIENTSSVNDDSDAAQ